MDRVGLVAPPVALHRSLLEELAHSPLNLGRGEPSGHVVEEGRVPIPPCSDGHHLLAPGVHDPEPVSLHVKLSEEAVTPLRDLRVADKNLDRYARPAHG